MATKNPEYSKITCDDSLLNGWACQTLPVPAKLSANVHELVSSGLVWRGSQGDVDNLWEGCSHRSEVIPFNAPEIDRALSGGGLSCGALHEFYYRDPSRKVETTVAIPALLARNAIDTYYASPSSAWSATRSGALPFFIAWIGRKCWPTPFFIPQELLSSCLFIDPPSDALSLWAIETALRSPLIKLVIAVSPRINIKTSKRLSLRARAHGTTAFLIRSIEDLSMPSSSATKWSLSPLPTQSTYPLWNLSLERNKGAALPQSSWTIGIETRYEEREAVSLRVLPRVVDTGYSEGVALKRFG